AGRDRRQRPGAARRGRHARRCRGARTQERHGDDGHRQVDQRDHPDVIAGGPLMIVGHRRLLLLAVLALLAAVPAAQARAAAQAQITVYAAASLTDVFPTIAEGNRYSFGGSNTLAAQIQQGAPADVFASANTTLPTQLFAKGLCSKPVVFTRNTLV